MYAADGNGGALSCMSGHGGLAAALRRSYARAVSGVRGGLIRNSQHFQAREVSIQVSVCTSADCRSHRPGWKMLVTSLGQSSQLHQEREWFLIRAPS